jgi:hypothetical protein
MEEVKKHPAYKEAIDRIIERFESDGYGCFISDQDFDRYMSIDPPIGQMTYAKFKHIEMERLQRYAAIEKLLVDHNICLMRSKTQDGFDIVSPRDQINLEYGKRMKKAKKELSRAFVALTNIQYEMLTMEEGLDRERKIMKAAFIKSAMNRKSVPSIVESAPAKKLASVK